MILGGLLVPHESELMRIASNDARTASFTSEWRGADRVAIAGGNEICVKTGIVEIDTTGDPDLASSTSSSTIFLSDKEFGFEHLKQYDFLREIVLIFNDGPWPERRIRQNGCREPATNSALRRTRINTIQLGRLQAPREFGLRAVTYQPPPVVGV